MPTPQKEEPERFPGGADALEDQSRYGEIPGGPMGVDLPPALNSDQVQVPDAISEPDEKSQEPDPEDEDAEPETPVCGLFPPVQEPRGGRLASRWTSSGGLRASQPRRSSKVTCRSPGARRYRCRCSGPGRGGDRRIEYWHVARGSAGAGRGARWRREPGRPGRNGGSGSAESSGQALTASFEEVPHRPGRTSSSPKTATVWLIVPWGGSAGSARGVEVPPGAYHRTAWVRRTGPSRMPTCPHGVSTSTPSMGASSKPQRRSPPTRASAGIASGGADDDVTGSVGSGSLVAGSRWGCSRWGLGSKVGGGDGGRRVARRAGRGATGQAVGPRTRCRRAPPRPQPNRGRSGPPYDDRRAAVASCRCFEAGAMGRRREPRNRSARRSVGHRAPPFFGAAHGRQLSRERAATTREPRLHGADRDPDSSAISATGRSSR